MRNILRVCLMAIVLAGCSSEPHNSAIMLEKPGSKDTARCIADTQNKETYAQVEKCAQDFEKKGFERTESH